MRGMAALAAAAIALAGAAFLGAWRLLPVPVA